MKTIAVVCQLTLLCIIGGWNLLAQSPARIAPAIEAVSHPIASLSLSAPNTDLRALKPYLAEVQVLGLGEATHGTHDFFALKSRMIRYAIEELGYKVVAFEAPLGDERADAFIVHGIGTAEDALLDLGYWPWETESVKSLLIWLREHNASLPLEERVRFVGIDMQGFKGIRPLAELWQSPAWQVPAHFHTTAAELITVPYYKGRLQSRTWLESMVQWSAEVEQWLVDHQSALVDSLGKEGFQFMQHRVRVVEQALVASIEFKQEGVNRLNFRDSCMGVNMAWVVQEVFPGEKAALWAHNGHICHYEGSFKFGVRRTMGHYLQRWLGKGYYAMSLDFGEGGFRAVHSKESVKQNFYLTSRQRKSLGWYMEPVSEAMFFMDWEEVSNQVELAKWSQKPIAYLQIGAGFMPPGKLHYLKAGPLPEFYDGCLFVQRTSPAQPILYPRLTTKLPVKELVGRKVRLTMQMRPLGKDTTIVPYLKLHCWTQTSTLADYKAIPVWNAENGWWQMTIEDTIPVHTEILQLYGESKQSQGLDVDVLSIYIQDQAGNWQLSQSSVNFEQEAGTERVKVGEGMTLIRSESAAYEGLWGLRIAPIQ